MKLNVGCGSEKYEGFVNIDCNESLKPDLVCDIRKHNLPYADSSIDEIWFIHTIEHIEEEFHEKILEEFYRVLHSEGKLVIAYPEFTLAATAYLENKRGNRDFYKHVIYGRQLYKSDYHVSLMDTRYFIRLLKQIGFKHIRVMQEPVPNEFNTVIQCVKGTPLITREELLRREVCES